MDLSTVLGVALAWLFVGTAIYLGADGKAAALIDPTSFLVVLGGCTAATMAAFPFSRGLLALGALFDSGVRVLLLALHPRFVPRR